MATCGTLEIDQAFDGGNGDGDDFDPSLVEVAGCSSVPESVESGQRSTVGVIVDNGNDQSAEATISVKADAFEIGRSTVTVPPTGQQYGVDFTAPSGTDDYTLNVDIDGNPQPATAFSREAAAAASDVVSVLCGGTLTPTNVICSGAPVDVDVTLLVENLGSNALNVDITPTIDGVQFPQEDAELVLTAGEERQTTHTVQLPAPANEPLLPCGGSVEIGAEVTSVQVIGGLTPAVLARRARLDRETLGVAAAGAGTGLVAALISRRS